MELTPIIQYNNIPKEDNIIYSGGNSNIIELPPKIKRYEISPFVEANTKKVSLLCLKNDCIIPVFAKDNERTISHQEFIEITQDCVNSVFPNHNIESPEIRVSHQIKGRTPEAIHKPAKDLFDNEKTQYFERMAFIMRIPFY